MNQNHASSNNMTRYDHAVDASGLHCPLPLLRLKKALLGMASGEIVKIVATDPAAHLDFGVFAEQSGHRILHHTQENGTHCFFIEKK